MGSRGEGPTGMGSTYPRPIPPSCGSSGQLSPGGKWHLQPLLQTHLLVTGSPDAAASLTELDSRYVSNMGVPLRLQLFLLSCNALGFAINTSTCKG
jgi:hypothetical protein